MPIRALLESMRPHQWVKNLLVFAPLVFAHKLGDSASVVAALRAFAAFCAAASGVYLLNDVADRRADREHPTKRSRPIASGRLHAGPAVGAAIALIAIALAISATLPADATGLPFAFWTGAYLAINLAYSFALKRIAIVDGICIALGFQFRVHAGSVAIGVPSSRWLLLCTFFFALFVAFGKRRDELVHLGEPDGSSSGLTRASLRDYSVPFLDQIIAPLAALSILSYALYTFDDETVRKHGPNLFLTVPFVVFGVFRYLGLIHSGRGGNPAAVLFSDRQLQISGLLWIASVLAIIG